MTSKLSNIFNQINPTWYLGFKLSCQKNHTTADTKINQAWIKVPQIFIQLTLYAKKFTQTLWVSLLGLLQILKISL